MVRMYSGMVFIDGKPVRRDSSRYTRWGRGSIFQMFLQNLTNMSQETLGHSEVPVSFPLPQCGGAIKMYREPFKGTEHMCAHTWPRESLISQRTRFPILSAIYCYVYVIISPLLAFCLFKVLHKSHMLPATFLHE